VLAHILTKTEELLWREREEENPLLQPPVSVFVCSLVTMYLLGGGLLLLLLCLDVVIGFVQRPRIIRTTAIKALDIPLIPALIGTTVLVFGAFNLPDNKIDLTDRGIAMAKQKRRQERIARGEFKPKDQEGLDPYRYRIPILDDDDEDLLDPSSLIGGKKKSGGCG